MVKPAYTALAVLAVMLLGLLWIRLTWRPSGEPLRAPAARNAGQLALTGATARLQGQNYLQSAVMYAQTIYAAAQEKDRPGAVVLVRDDDLPSALVTTRLQHFPVNAPMLYVTNGGTTLPPETRDELLRLDPEGVMMDNNVQVYLVGDIAADVVRAAERLRFRVRRIYATNPVQLTERLDEFIAVMEANRRRPVFVGALDAPEYLLAVANWNAHMGDGVVFVTPDGIPPETRRVLARREPNHAYIYLFAPPEVISEEVAAELSRYGHVQRVPGNTPSEMAVEWAGYDDRGRLLGWWFGQRSREVGWGTDEPGHNLILANPTDWREIVPTGVLSHMGKHAFLILTEPGGTLPESAVRFLDGIKPTRTHPSQQVFNYAWVVGTGIPAGTVRQLDALLAVTPRPQAIADVILILSRPGIPHRKRVLVNCFISHRASTPCNGMSSALKRN